MLLTGMGEGVDEVKSQGKSKKSQVKRKGSAVSGFQGYSRVRRGDRATRRWGEFVIGEFGIVLIFHLNVNVILR
jgi:hypothetical protein